jgi:D-galactose 1-dehydrogenase
MIRCGLIGLGTIGQLYCQLLAQHGQTLGLEIIAAADPAPVATPAGIRRYTTHEQLLGESDVQAVLVASPPAFHVTHARDCLASGKDVLLEKPPARSVAEVRELVSLSEQRALVLFFAYHARYGAAVALANSLLDSVHLETLCGLRAMYRENVNRFHRNSTWIHSEGIVRDSGINLFSVLTYLLGEDLHVSAARLQRDEQRGSITGATIDMILREKVAARLQLEWTDAQVEERTIALQFEDESWSIDIAGDRLSRDTRPIGQERGPNSLAREYQGLLEHFSRCLQQRRSLCSVAEVRLVEETEHIARSSK